MSSNHLNKNILCEACGLSISSVGKFNKYYSDSALKSLAVINYGKKYFKILKSYNLDILVLTDFHKRYLIDLGVNAEKITTYPNYLDVDVTFAGNNILERDYLVYAGRVSEEKGVNELIETFIKADLKNIILKVIGKGPNLDNLKRIYKNNKKIEFVGEKSNLEVLDIIANSIAVATATKLYEGQPTLLCEASALGIPSIFPNTGGIKEFFPSKYELAFNQFDYKDLENKLKLLNNIEKRIIIGKKNQEYISDYLSKKRLKSIMTGIYE